MSEQKAIWVTHDGRHIPVEEMTDAHLANAIAMLDRQLADIDKELEWRERTSTFDEWTEGDTIIGDRLLGVTRNRKVLVAERNRRAKGHAAE